MGKPDNLNCLLRNPYADQEATVRTGHENRLIQNWERSMSRLYIVTLLPLFIEESTVMFNKAKLNFMAFCLH